MKPVLETKSTYKGYPYVVLFMPGGIQMWIRWSAL